MKTFRNQRLREVVEYLKNTGKVDTNTEFYERIGKNKSQMSDTLCCRRSVSNELVDIICGHYPEINPAYLLDPAATEMLIDRAGGSVQVSGDGNNVNNGHDQCIHPSADTDRLLAIIEKQQEQIDTLLRILAAK